MLIPREQVNLNIGGSPIKYFVFKTNTLLEHGISPENQG
jgi:hypothetical protein